MRTFIRNLTDDTAGATAVEYGLILGLVVLGMLAALQGTGNEVIGMWNQVSDTVVTSSAQSGAV